MKKTKRNLPTSTAAPQPPRVPPPQPPAVEITIRLRGRVVRLGPIVALLVLIAGAVMRLVAR